ncbi:MULTISPECIES: ABC transporter ATP-binding protein [Hungatella]|uniref:ATP-binding cassette domain-containing protein n=2 Tax=Hungatella hathewayi TaxID=154046 RepID=A0A174UC84_9FIRM|nr:MULTISPECIES: ABC transporter ATP-binding protein [Hungatella]MCD7999725.1 ABC transporter ATP-binding protein/permease [Clostridiales bacterium]MBT9799603.1 ATP-binding cassette domain-containing protein [Hungatella hathewayi]MCI7382731.1 ABC transporter ATP-binding protein/permease [Hungatella sp.]MCQ4830912.1 ABC transporter ATP-binding protein/permease [Hungatella sp. SL.1.14]MCQ5386569.1 ABC transporter ATP-binding protein/permease [Hungatella hathewayi]
MKKIFSYYLKPYYLRMAVGFLIKFTGTLMDLFLPWTLAYMIDTVIPANQRPEIFLWGFFMIFCSVLAVVFSVAANRMASRVASSAIETIRGDLFEKVSRLSNTEIDRFTRPSLISRLTSDTYNVHQMLGRVQRLGVRAPILLIGGITMTMALDPVLACILLAVLPLLTLVVVVVSKKTIPMFSVLQDRVDRFVRLIREDIAGIRVIKALSKESYERERFDQANREVVDWERKATVTTSITNPVMNVLLNLGLVAVILTGAFRVNQGTSEVGKILAFMTYFTIILNALMSISRLFIMISKAAASAARIVTVLEADQEMVLQELETDEEAAMAEAEADSVHVEFDHVSFSYNKVENNLENISFRLKRGETLGIIGATGAGKTTIVNLLMRFYDADQGTVRIDGKDVRTMGLHELRKRFGAVFQNDTIFEDTIMENINMGRDLSEEAVMEAVLYGRASEFVAEKGGISEQLDIKGANLSGGQKQRILIARALAARPDILILDDSSSALDYKTDAALRKELREHFAETTCVIIAQRISSIMNSDHIMVLEDGQMIGYGTHRELMETCEIYREIGKSQMGI